MSDDRIANITSTADSFSRVIKLKIKFRIAALQLGIRHSANQRDDDIPLPSASVPTSERRATVRRPLSLLSLRRRRSETTLGSGGRSRTFVAQAAMESCKTCTRTSRPYRYVWRTTLPRGIVALFPAAACIVVKMASIKVELFDKTTKGLKTHMFKK